MQAQGGYQVGGGGDSELVSKQLQLEQKLYYLDLKDNSRGRFLKISERTQSSRSTIIVPLNGIVWFVDLFNYYANGDDAELSSKELQLETKVFYFDVGENPRGRYLKVSEAQVPRNSYSRSSIIVPAGSNRDEGWAAFRNILVEIHEASLSLPPHPVVGSSALQPPSGPGSVPAQGVPLAPSLPSPAVSGPAAPPLSQVPAQVPGLAVGGGVASGNGTVGTSAPGAIPASTASKVIRAEQKKFFLDLGSNSRGHFLRISEVLGSVRSAIILPASALEELHDSLGQFLEVLRKQGSLQPGSHVQVRSIPSLPSKAADGEAVGS